MKGNMRRGEERRGEDRTKRRGEERRKRTEVEIRAEGGGGRRQIITIRNVEIREVGKKNQITIRV